MDKLLPCPFCGGESLLRDRYINGVANTKHYIRECHHCKATFAHWFRSIKRANEAWNRRADPESKPLTLDEIILRCTPKAAELLKSGQLGAIKVCAVSESIHPTNADRIRSMSDEELAEYIFDLGNGPERCDRHCAYQDDCNAEWRLNYNTCIKRVTEWLKQPLKEE